MSIRGIGAGLALLLLAADGAYAQAVPVNANVVASCGTVNGTSYAAGTNRPATQDTTGKLCTGATITPGGTQDVNLKQVNGATVNVGVGAASAGTQRVTTSTDSTIGTVTTVTSATVIQPTAANLNATVVGTGTFAVQATITPSSSSAVAIAHGQSTATESGHAAICAAACNLYSLTATNLSATTVLMLMIFNSTTVPGDGAVTPDQCLPVSPGPGATGISSAGGPPTRYGTGLSVALSSGASCTTKTASVNGFFTWAVQ